MGGVRAREVWGIGGRCTGAPGGVEEVGLLAVLGLVEFWSRPVSGRERGSLDRVWEDEDEMGSVEEEIGSVDVDRSLSEDLEL